MSNWCEICKIDLQSAKCLEEHCRGRKHQKRAQRTNGVCKRPLSLSLQPPIDQEQLFQDLAKGKFQNIVVLTGAGVSTAAGIPDYRSPGNGLFDMLKRTFCRRFPAVLDTPEILFSRQFVDTHPDVWRDEIWPLAHEKIVQGLEPTLTHRFCAWLHGQGWLRRVYTQNVDGLHTHPSLNLPQELVVECHGSLLNEGETLVRYGDKLPDHFFESCARDFDLHSNSNKVDLLLVMGTSLQVAPFCAVPNLAQRGCVRVLVNRDLQDCVRNDFSSNNQYLSSSIRLGGRKSVSLRPLWTGRKGNSKWRQCLIESDCDAFVEAFFAYCREKGLELETLCEKGTDAL